MPEISGMAGSGGPGVVTITAAGGSTLETNTSTWEFWNNTYVRIAQTYTNRPVTAATAYAMRVEMDTALAVWTSWNITYAGASASTTNTAVWTAWVDDHVVFANNRENKIRQQVAAGRQPSVEERERWRQDEIRRREQEAQRLRVELEAKDKAIVLLKSCLTQQQKEEYERDRCFHLLVGEKKYRIEQGSHGNVKLIDRDGKIKRSFCVQPRGVPEGDAMLAQKLLLESDEKRFYELANVSEYGPDGLVTRTHAAPQGAVLLRDLLQGQHANTG